MPTPSLLQRLKERKLVQWALEYLVLAVAVLGVMDAVNEALTLSRTAQQAILILILFGFFLTLILAWFHGEKGHQKVTAYELFTLGVLVVAAGVGLSLIGGPPTPDPVQAGSPGDDRSGVAVFPFKDLSPAQDHGDFASGVAEELTSRLSGISTLRVIASLAVEAYRDPESRPPIPQVSAALGAGFLLTGSVRIVAHSLRARVAGGRSHTRPGGIRGLRAWEPGVHQ